MSIRENPCPVLKLPKEIAEEVRNEFNNYKIALFPFSSKSILGYQAINEYIDENNGISMYFVKGGSMEKRINRFKLCDLNFHPYLKKVIERLPDDVREDVLNDKSFQILTDDDALNACVLRYRFSVPVKTLVYLNTTILKEPEHQIVHTIVSEIAHYVLNKRKTALRSKDIDNLLLQWGFEKEVEAVRLGRILWDSKGYKIGYEWAKKQNRDYLMQHFGLYYDEWNEKGLVGFSDEGSEMANHLNGTGSILENIIHPKTTDTVEPRKDTLLETRSLRKTMLAGILAAVKEANL